MASTYTSYLQLEKPEYGRVGWDTILGSNLDLLDQGISGAYFKAIATVDVSAYQLVAWDPSNAGSVVVATNTGTIRTAIGMAMSTVTAGNTVAIVRCGLITNAGWAWTINHRLFLGPTGTIVAETSSSRYGDSGIELFLQPVGIAVATNIIALLPSRSFRSVISIVPSIDSVASSGSPTKALVTTSGSGKAITYVLSTGNKMVYGFLLPNNWQSFPAYAIWGIRVNYLASVGTATIAYSNIWDGAGNNLAAGFPASGSSTTWGAYSLNMNVIDDIAGYAKGQPFYVELTAGGTGTITIESIAMVRYFPEESTFE